MNIGFNGKIKRPNLNVNKLPQTPCKIITVSLPLIFLWKIFVHKTATILTHKRWQTY